MAFLDPFHRAIGRFVELYDRKFKKRMSAESLMGTLPLDCKLIFGTATAHAAILAVYTLTAQVD